MLRHITLKVSLLLVIATLIAACGQPQQPDGPGKPKPPPPPDGYAHSSVAAGWEHNLLLREDGTVAAWGRNNYGQLGNGTKEDSLHSSVTVLGLTDDISVHTRNSSSFALREDGTVWAWGRNSGYLGIGTTTLEELTPTQISGLSDVVQLDVGDEHVLAVT